MSQTTERDRLVEWAKVFPRHFWALCQISQGEAIRGSIARQIRRGESLSQKQLNFLWHKADEIEWQNASNVPPPQRGTLIQTSIRISTTDPDTTTPWGEAVYRISFLAYPDGWRGRLDIPKVGNKFFALEYIDERQSDFAYIEGKVVWQKGGLVIVDATTFTLAAGKP